MSKRAVSPRPRGEGWEWVEEFSGGKWVRFRVRPTTPRAVLKAALYGPAYQGPTSTRQSVGLWSQFRGPGT